MKQNSDNMRVSLIGQIKLPWITVQTRGSTCYTCL